MKKNNFLMLLLSISIFSFLLSCNQSEKLQKEPVESINAGELTVYCDEGIYPLMDSIFKMYRTSYPKVKLTSECVDSRKTMYLLLSGNARVIITARDYLKDEDSLLKAFNIAPHQKMEIAQDALVFYTSPDFPLDTINDNQLFRLMTERETSFRTFFPSLKEEPKFFCNNHLSSEYANLNKLVAKNKPIARKINLMAGYDSVKQTVKSTPYAIGIGYLSQVVHNPNYKVLRVGYTKENGKREFPQVVHQAYIVQNRYPYIISYWVYLLEDRRNLPFYFASFVSKERIAQFYLKEAGIVPAYARFKLIKD